jgi:cardiolipin synthase
MAEFLQTWWPSFIAGLTTLVSAATSLHAVMFKRDVRAAAAWAGISWLVPIIGPLLYLLLGVNRIERRASQLRPSEGGEYPADAVDGAPASGEPERRMTPSLPPTAAHLEPLVSLVDRVVGMPLLAGNRVAVLVDGDEAYPAMVAAIDAARFSVGLSTYIFDNDPAGDMFSDALERAVARGVEVRVLIDAVGARYSWPSSVRALAARGIPCARFLPSVWPWRMPYMNLRNHRKFLIIDGKKGFTGGMNIRVGHMRESEPRSPIRDLQFCVEGPAVAQFVDVFTEDWSFAADEVLDGDAWRSRQDVVGAVAIRGIPDGPDRDLDKLHWTMLAALTTAKRSVRIATPYFLPDEALITALNLAALRGVQVEILLPKTNNLRLVKWAEMHQLGHLIRRGCKIVLTKGVFDHSKVFVVDDVWSLVGSANWDPRSLRLNFEFDIECYDVELASTLNGLLDEKAVGGWTLSMSDLQSRHPIVKARDAIARLASPYL